MGIAHTSDSAHLPRTTFRNLAEDQWVRERDGAPGSYFSVAGSAARTFRRAFSRFGLQPEQPRIN